MNPLFQTMFLSYPESGIIIINKAPIISVYILTILDWFGLYHCRGAQYLEMY